jgi:hypothetical protein
MVIFADANQTFTLKNNNSNEQPNDSASTSNDQTQMLNESKDLCSQFTRDSPREPVITEKEASTSVMNRTFTLENNNSNEQPNHSASTSNDQTQMLNGSKDLCSQFTGDSPREPVITEKEASTSVIKSNFSFNLSPKEYEEIAPKRGYNRLTQPWTDIFY